MELQDMEKLMPLLDRIMLPVIQKFDQLEQRQREDTIALHNKLDKVAEVAGAVTAHEGRLTSVETAAQVRMTNLEKALTTNEMAHLSLARSVDAVQLSLATVNGRNQVVMWMMGLIGAPIVVGLCLAGIAKIMGIHIP